MASVPGMQTSQGGMGWDFNAAYVRGQNSYYTGYEYDGIPVNRSFDNYNSSTESSLGLQELQVYTGGGPSSVASAGTAGFINQVIKTGTFPGYATANLGLGRRRSTIRRRSRSADRRPIGPSATTSVCSATTKTIG